MLKYWSKAVLKEPGSVNNESNPRSYNAVNITGQKRLLKYEESVEYSTSIIQITLA